MDDQIVKTEEEWKKKLTPEQYHIMRERGTEPAFSGKYYSEHSKGMYRCATCSRGMNRTEVLCGKCGSHLGHIFNDGPSQDGGKRYCINSLALDLEKKNNLL